jgi:hypothetical protein
VNPEFRKVAAGLGLIVSLYFALSPGGDDETTPTTSAAQTTTATTTAPAEPQVVRISVSVPGDKAPAVKHFTIQQGRQVVFVVKSELADEVHLHGYDLSRDVRAGGTARIPFTAKISGRFEVELENRGLPIAEITVK